MAKATTVPADRVRTHLSVSERLGILASNEADITILVAIDSDDGPPIRARAASSRTGATGHGLDGTSGELRAPQLVKVMHRSGKIPLTSGGVVEGAGSR